MNLSEDRIIIEKEDLQESVATIKEVMQNWLKTDETMMKHELHAYVQVSDLYYNTETGESDVEPNPEKFDASLKELVLLFAKNDGSVASYMIYRDDDTIAQMMGVEKESMTYYDFILNEETETDADTLELLPEDHEEITLETRIKSFLAAELGEELEEEDDSEENQEFDEEV